MFTIKAKTYRTVGVFFNLDNPHNDDFDVTNDTKKGEYAPGRWEGPENKDAADGTKVWSENTIDSKNIKERNDKPEKWWITPEKFQEQQDIAKKPVTEYAEHTEDAKAAIETPKTAAKTQETLDKWMNSLFP